MTSRATNIRRPHQLAEAVMHQDSFATALWSNQQQWRLALQPGNQALNDIAFPAGHDQPCISLSCASFKKRCAWCLTPATTTAIR